MLELCPIQNNCLQNYAGIIFASYAILLATMGRSSGSSCLVFSLTWPCNPHECKKEEHVENLVCMLATQHSEIKNGLSN